MIYCLYQESIRETAMEKIQQGIQYLDGLIPFRANQISKETKGIEKAVGIKEEEVLIRLEPIREGVSIRFKKNDRVYVFGNEYRILSVEEFIPKKWETRASKSEQLYRKYVKYVLSLGV